MEYFNLINVLQIVSNHSLRTSDEQGYDESDGDCVRDINVGFNLLLSCVIARNK